MTEEERAEFMLRHDTLLGLTGGPRAGGVVAPG